MSEIYWFFAIQFSVVPPEMPPELFRWSTRWHGSTHLPLFGDAHVYGLPFAVKPEVSLVMQRLVFSVSNDNLILAPFNAECLIGTLGGHDAPHTAQHTNCVPGWGRG